ncbi:MAG TPA: VOC family protein [Chitinophagaceae bacterium]|jgi:catechol 2,3-dioxygenase-like lactoylglutathione lyase family enzyme|nr:VOC family protein [Chitinophagaceae bacterium]
MKLEHIALNVKDPIAVAHWYTEHLGLAVVQQKMEAPYTTFMADDSGQMLIEIYNNPPDGVPDYNAMDPLLLHIAFVSESPHTDKARLITAGATLENELHLQDGTHLVMLRDPWGLAIQLCKRAIPLIRIQ